MNTTRLKKKSNSLWNAHNKLEDIILELKLMLNPYITFEFNLTYCPGDGYCILDAETDEVAPLDSCIKIIEDTGKITRKEHNSIII